LSDAKSPNVPGTESESYFPLKSLPSANVPSGVLAAPCTPLASHLEKGYSSTTPAGEFPVTREQARQDLLRESGALDRAVPIVTKMIQRLDEQLDAKKTHIAAFEGKITDTLVTEDNSARLAAVKAAGELFDIYRPRSDAPGANRPVQINLIWPGWSSPPPKPTIDVEVVEVGETQ